MSTQPLREQLRAARVLPVVTLPDADRGPALMAALRAGGLNAIEVTLRTPAGLPGIAKIREAFPDAVLGAGTILTPDDLAASAEAGADFTVSPGFTPELIDAARRAPVPWLPGAGTAAEVHQLFAAGFTSMKLFPAMAAGGEALLKALAPVFADVAFCPTGGISGSNAPAVLSLPNVVAVGGSWIAPDALVREAGWEAVTVRAREAAAALSVQPFATAES